MGVDGEVSEGLARSLVEGLSEMALLCDRHGVIELANGVLRRFYGKDVIEGLSLSALLPISEAANHDPEACELFVRGALEGSPFEMESTALRADGQLRSLRTTLRRVVGDRLLMVMYDRTEQRSIENDAALYRRVVESCQDLVMVIDQGGGVLYGNGACRQSLGYDPEAMVGTALFDYVHPRDLGLVWQILQEATASEEGLEETLRFMTVSGSVRHLNFVARGMVRRDQSVDILMVARDDTDQHQLQQALLESQKMEGMGRLARGIAHDFNNLLQLILGSVQCLDNEEELPESVCEWHDTIRTAAERGRTLVEQLQAFSTRDVGLRLPHTLGSLCDDLIGLVRPMLSRAVEFSAEIHNPHCVIEVNPGQLHQVLVNFCINAREAIGGEGEIQLKTSPVQRGERAFVAISVSDTGRGIPEEHLSRIFEPFFSTKDHRRGTGLGLSVAYGIVEAHGGHIEVESQEGAGSTFRALLPLAPKGTQPVSQEHPQKVFGNDELILVVDDEPMQRTILRKQLEFLGYGVLTAEDGARAVDLYGDYVDEISCVLLDVVMPRLNGRETLGVLMKINPDIHVIVTTGLGRDESVASMIQAGARAFLAKPFHIEHLGSVLRAVIDGEPVSREHLLTPSDIEPDA